jgi:hypothetical protein
MLLTTLVARIAYIVRSYSCYKSRISEFYPLRIFVYSGNSRFAVFFLRFG